MNERNASALSRWRRRGSWPGAVFLLFAIAGPAGAQEFIVPPTLLIPNYDRVNPGLTESLEAGAYIARARNAPALFYNPAGIATVQRTVLNASAQGYQLTTLGGTGFDRSSPVSSFEPLPSFIGVVLGKDVIDWERVRLGISIATPVHWNQSANASSIPTEGQRISYAVHSTFDTLVPTFAAAWEASSTFRLGGSIEFPYTTISNTGSLSGEITDSTTSRGTLRTLSAGGSTLQIQGVVGAQWDVLQWLSIGARLRSPGLKLTSKGNFLYEAITNTLTGTRHTYFLDPSAQFEYRLPLDVSLGAAVRFGPVEIEADVRFHDGTHSYTLLASQQTARIVDTTGGGAPVISSEAFPGVNYRARQVWNGSLGAHVSLSPSFIISAGSYLDYSPADPSTSVFRHVDLIGFRLGAAFKIDKLSASLGAGWEHGTGTDDLFPSGLPIPGETSDITLDTFTLLFSVSFAF
jgi:hypothetical protein